jgi:cytochrome o ubiquinol oxidase operon protein cyoD
VAASATFGAILMLALVQTIVHFRFFLHIGLKKSSRQDLQLVLFSAAIVALMVSGTLVVLFNLRSRMM